MQIITLRSNKGLSNTYVVKNNNECIIIDCGVTLSTIIKEVKNCKVQAILVTHGHFDHITYLNEYVKEFNCKVYCSSLCYEKLGDADKNLSKIFLKGSITARINDYVCLDEVKNINIADMDVHILSLKGHSECSLGYKIQNNLFCGDVLFKNAIGRTDFYDGNMHKINKSIQCIKMLSPVNVFCGHGENFTL